MLMFINFTVTEVIASCQQYGFINYIIRHQYLLSLHHCLEVLLNGHIIVIQIHTNDYEVYLIVYRS